MKNKIVIIFLVIFVIVLAILAGVYFIKQNKPVANPAENTAQENRSNAQANEDAAPPKNQNQNDPLKIEAVQVQNKMVTDKFEVIVPMEWVQTTPATGASLMAINPNEIINDPTAQKINFKSYFAVSHDTLQSKTLEEYAQTIKDSIQQMIPNVIFTKSQDIEAINGKAAYTVETDMFQKEVNFKALMVMVKGEGDDVWVISFNTTKSAWAGYEQPLRDVINSFKLKK